MLQISRMKFGAGDGTQTRDLCLGKASLYQLSYSRISLNKLNKSFNFSCWGFVFPMRFLILRRLSAR